jgi:hypothetical protein
LRVQKEQQFAHLYCLDSAAADTFYLSISKDIPNLLAEWTVSSRISPIWRVLADVEQAEHPSDLDGAHIYFVCGKDPSWLVEHLTEAALEMLNTSGIWLTLGAYSLMLVCCHEAVDDELETVLSKHAVPFERWKASEYTNETQAFGDTIDYVNLREMVSDHSHPNSPLIDELKELASTKADATHGFMILELCTLLSAAHSRARSTFPQLVNDFDQIEALAIKLLGQAKKTNGDLPVQQPSTDKLYEPIIDASRQDILLTLNAGLSRMVSQVFSGVSPIVRTECHFWPHSFLGIGVANLALRNVSYFVSSIVNTSKFNRSFSTHYLRDIPRSFEAITKLDHGQPLFRQVPTSSWSKLGIDTSVAKPTETADDLESFYHAPCPITYFSGRDGFRNAILTTSAPLNSVAGCNSYQWNLGTITHELSHRIIDGKINRLRRDFVEVVRQSSAAGEAIDDLFKRENKTIGDLGSKLLGFYLLVMHAQDYETRTAKKKFEDMPTFFENALKEYGERIEELLVHAFDFFHFYESDSKSYVDFVWQSWAVQPSIHEKVDEYIKRTLFALATKAYGTANWTEIAIEDFKSVLESEPVRSRLPIQPEILRRLAQRESRKQFSDLLMVAHPLLDLFHLLFRSPNLRALASKDAFAVRRQSSRGRGETAERRILRYPATMGQFGKGNKNSPAVRFQNPVMFLRDYSRNEAPNAADSAWLLHMLAFNWVQPSSDEGASL